jgi:uncharacterized membrane protein
MEAFDATLVVATLLCSLVAGLLFAFAVVVMPGIRGLDDDAFLRSFQEMDAVIQRNQPLFVLAWAGSVPMVVAAAGVSIASAEGPARWATIAAAATYLLGVQLPTLAVNVPLNHQLQAVDVASLSAAESRATRLAFEPRWNRWNVVRTVLAIVVTLLLLVARTT